MEDDSTDEDSEPWVVKLEQMILYVWDKREIKKGSQTNKNQSRLLDDVYQVNGIRPSWRKITKGFKILWMIELWETLNFEFFYIEILSWESKKVIG